jgi:hypothetical protein
MRRPAPTASNPARLKLIGFRILMLGLVVLVFAFSRAWGKLETRRWPTADATVVFSEVVERTGKTHEWCVQVGYRYSVDGGRQGGAKRWECSASRTGAEAKLAMVAPGQRLAVHYDPARPQRSVLQAASLDAIDAFIGALGLILAVVGVDRIRQARKLAATTG